MFRIAVLIGFVLFAGGPAWADNTFIALSYHDVRDDLAGDMDEDQLALGTRNLVAEFSWLREHGYHVVSMDTILAAASGRSTLPDRAVLLTFDDGYASFYSRVYPLLKLFRYPALVAVVGKWMEGGEGSVVSYGHGRGVPRSTFLSWPQIREMQDSGLVEVASHSFDLHRGVRGNPQGNDQPAAVTRIYDAATHSYESDRDYQTRIREDLKKSRDAIWKYTGRSPRVIVWPYGAYSRESVAIAESLGMPLTIGLADGANALESVSPMNRILVQENPDLESFVYQIRHPDSSDPLRVVHIDLDYIYDPDAARTEQNLGRWLDRIQALKVNTVFLQAFADPDGDGNADQLYFPNRWLPVRADLFNRVAWQLKTRAGVSVYAWMPVLAFDFAVPEDWKVQEWNQGNPGVAEDNYKRLSPFHPGVRRAVGEIYEDLAKHAAFAGLLFHDDAFLSDFEDANPHALEYYRSFPELSGDLGIIRSDDRTRRVWTRAKTEALNEFTRYLTDRVRRYRPEIKTARNLYARPVLDPESEAWFAQSFTEFLKNYDYTAVMAMPFMEHAEEPSAWLSALVDRVKIHPGAFKKTIFELQSVDWNSQEKIPGETLIEQMNLLQQNGATQFGYYPDDLFEDQPRLSDLKRSMSLRTFPFGP